MLERKKLKSRSLTLLKKCINIGCKINTKLTEKLSCLILRTFDIINYPSKMPLRVGYQPFFLNESKIKLQDIKKWLKQKRCACLFFIVNIFFLILTKKCIFDSTNANNCIFWQYFVKCNFFAFLCRFFVQKCFFCKIVKIFLQLKKNSWVYNKMLLI